MRKAGDRVRCVHGELDEMTAGAGGDAVPSAVFPPAVWTSALDEKGGPGGGGGGALRVWAIGRITFGQNGEVRANGGSGATGENASFLNHVGGSGGHVVLESGTQIDFSDGGHNAPRTFVSAAGGPLVTGPPTSGGNVSFGGPGGPGLIQLHVPNPRQPASPALSQIVLPAVPASVEDLTSPAPWVLVPLSFVPPSRSDAMAVR